MGKYILCLDFDGVIHSYTSGWKGADVIPDPPVEGAFEFIKTAMEEFKIAVFSSRSHQPGGINAMQAWFRIHSLPTEILDQIDFPKEKPSAFLTIDDRAITFRGIWPNLEFIRNFKPWNKR